MPNLKNCTQLKYFLLHLNVISDFNMGFLQAWEKYCSPK